MYLMPPQPSVPADRSRLPKSSISCQYAMLSRLFLLVLLVLIGLRIAIVRYSSGKRRKSTSKIAANDAETCPASCQGASEKDLTQDGAQNHQMPFYKPIYPWTSPPEPLPGPYNPRLYPLPTIRRHSYDPSIEEPSAMVANSYTRRVSLNNIPTQQGMLRGTVTTSPKGWRRNQWIISGA